MMWNPLWKRGDESNQAYLLKSGTLAFGSVPEERIEVDGKNLIIGSEEFLLAPGAPPLPRLCDWYAGDDADLVAVPQANLMALLPRYPVAHALCVHLAKLLLHSNRLYREARERDKDDDAAYQQSAKLYFGLVEEISAIADKFRFPPLVQLGERARNELLFEAGRILTNQEKMTFTPGNDSADVLAPGFLLCEQGATGEELFILMDGSIEVLVGGNKVAVIEDAGSVIGEIALFLGEKRTATLRVARPAKVARVNRANLPVFCQKNPAFLPTVAISCAKRFRNNLSLIRGLLEKPQPKPGQFVIPDFLRGRPGEDRIAAFLAELMSVQKAKKYEQLKGFLTKHAMTFARFKDMMES